MIKYCLSRYSGVEEKSEQYIEVEVETVRHSPRELILNLLSILGSNVEVTISKPAPYLRVENSRTTALSLE